MVYFLAFMAAMFMAIISIPPLLSLASKFNLVDEPDARKIHNRPVPRLGGVALVFSVILSILIWLPVQGQFGYLLAAIGVIFLAGLVDDLYDLDYRFKFFAQILVAILIVYGAGVGFQSLPIHAEVPWHKVTLDFISLVFIVGVINALNLADGMDGLAAGMSMISLAGISLLAIQSQVAPVLIMSVALIGGIFGFLRFNTYPAAIFMGDTGSQFLGLMLATFALILTNQPSDAYANWLPLLLVGLPIVDTLLVMSVRIWQKRSPFSPDRLHLHHRVLAAGFPQYWAVIVLYCLQLLYVLLAYRFKYQLDLMVLAGFVTLSLGCMLLVRFLPDLKARFDAVRCQYLKSRIAGTQDSRSKQRQSQHLLTGVISLVFIGLILNVVYIRSPVPGDIIIAVLMLVLYPLWRFLFKKGQALNSLERAIMYVVVVLVGYLQYQGHGWLAEWGWWQPLVLPGLLLLLMLKMTRADVDEFQANPLDFLILVLALIGALLMFRNEYAQGISWIILQTILLFYCVEILSISYAKRAVALRVSIIGFLSLLGTSALMSSW